MGPTSPFCTPVILGGNLRACRPSYMSFRAACGGSVGLCSRWPPVGWGRGRESRELGHKRPRPPQSAPVRNSTDATENILTPATDTLSNLPKHFPAWGRDQPPFAQSKDKARWLSTIRRMRWGRTAFLRGAKKPSKGRWKQRSSIGKGERLGGSYGAGRCHAVTARGVFWARSRNTARGRDKCAHLTDLWGELSNAGPAPHAIPLLTNCNRLLQFTGRRPDATTRALAGWPPPGWVAQFLPSPTPCSLHPRILATSTHSPFSGCCAPLFAGDSAWRAHSCS